MANVWDVYTVGDVSFVHEVFLGISHIFYGRGENVFLQVYMIGMLLGFIWIFIESMIQQKPIAIGRFFVAFILYSALFVPQATVHLEDSQTKKFYTMDHIPLGLAAGSSIVSKIGMGLTRTFEDFFTPIGGAGSGCSPTQMTCTGYLGSLNKIIQIRNNLSSKPAFLAIDRALCNASTDAPALPSDEQLVCNIEKTISNYVRDCSINKFLAKPQLLGTMRGLEDLRYGNASYSTDVYLQPTGKQTLNCHVAFQQIQARLTEKQSEIEKLSLKSEWITMTAHNHTGGGDDTDRMITGAGVNHNQITEILALMTGTSGTTPDAYAYIKNVMFRGPIEEGLIQGFTSAGDLRAAMMIKSAKDQRNIQWAAEENMWISTAKAMATFFEGFVVALAALIPFVMFMGGLNIMIEYLKVLMWVQLWNPVMAICNLYIQTVASQKVKDAIANSPITDLYVIDSVEEVAQHWIAVGGLMAATTPLLALFILKGSVYTFTTLASRMSGGDHVNEKMVSPDVMQHAPMIANSMGAYESKYGTRVMQSGGDFAYMNISLNDALSDSVQSSNKKAVSANENYLKSVANALGTQHSTEFGDTFLQTWKNSMDASHNNAWGDVQNVARSLAEQMGVGQDQEAVTSIASALTMNMGLDAAVGAKAGDEKSPVGAKLGAKLGINGSREHKDQFIKKFSTNWNKARAVVRSQMGSIADQNSLAKVNAEANQKALQAAEKHATNRQTVAQAQNSYNEQKSAVQEFNRNSTRQRSLQTSVSMKSNQLAELISDKDWDAWYGQLNPEDKKVLGWNNADDKWHGKTGTDAHNNKTTALEQLLGNDLGDASYLKDQFMERFGDTILRNFAGTGGAVNNFDLERTVHPDSTKVDRLNERVEKEVNSLESSNLASVQNGDQVRQDVKDSIFNAKENYKKNLDMSIDEIEAAQNEKRTEAAAKGQDYLNNPKGKADSSKAKILLSGVGNNEWNNFVEYLPSVLVGDDPQNAALAAFITQGAVYSQGHFKERNPVLYNRERLDIIKNSPPDGVAARLAALEAKYNGDGWMYDHRAVSDYDNLKQKAIQGMIDGGVEESVAIDLVNKFDVRSQEGRNGIGTLAKEYLGSGAKPGMPEDTARYVRGNNPSKDPGDIGDNTYASPIGKNNVTHVTKTPLTHSLIGIVGNGYKDAATLQKLRASIDW